MLKQMTVVILNIYLAFNFVGLFYFYFYFYLKKGFFAWNFIYTFSNNMK